MTLNKYLKGKTLSPITLLLIEKLKLFWENDEEFIVGVLVDLESDYERQQVIDFIDNGENVNYESIILLSLELCQQRENKR